VNLLSAYLKPRLDVGLSRLLKSWASRTDRKRAEREARLTYLAEHSDERLLEAVENLRRLIVSHLFLFLGMVTSGTTLLSTSIVSTLTGWILFAVGSGLCLIGGSYLISTAKTFSILEELHKKR